MNILQLFPNHRWEWILIGKKVGQGRQGQIIGLESSSRKLYKTILMPNLHLKQLNSNSSKSSQKIPLFNQGWEALVCMLPASFASLVVGAREWIPGSRQGCKRGDAMSVWGSPAEAWVGSGLPQVWGRWQQQSQELRLGISPLGSLLVILLKSILSINLAISAFLWLLFVWHLCFSMLLFSFYLYLSLWGSILNLCVCVFCKVP